MTFCHPLSKRALPATRRSSIPIRGCPIRILLLPLLSILLGGLESNAAAAESEAPGALQVVEAGSTNLESGRRSRDRDRDRGRDRRAGAEPSTTHAVSSEATSATNGSAGLDAFKILLGKNIFNANRGPRAGRSTNGPARRTPVVETFSLGGTMSYDKGPVAFFVSAASSYRMPAKVGDSIAGFRVKAIEPSGVKLEKDGAGFEMKVGEQMKREDQGAWSKPSQAEVVPVSSDAPAAPASSGGENDILKRLLEKRQKELNP